MSNGNLSDADRILHPEETAETDATSSAPSSGAPRSAETGADRGAARAKDGGSKAGGVLRWVVLAIVGVLIAVVGLGVWWSLQPPKFSVQKEMQARIGEDARPQAGAATVSAVITVGETLLHKPGGYLHNDVLPPGVLMDNMPNWEYGALLELRDTVRSLRNEFSRSQTQSIENDDLRRADAQFNVDAQAWMLPSAEDAYSKGIESLESYLKALQEGRSEARFYARADNLRAHLQVVEKRLGSYGQRLSASVGDEELMAALGAMRAESSNQEGQEEAPDAPPRQGPVRTAWHEIDDVFFEARGYAWALLHMMKAIAIDFEPVLRSKNAEVSMQQIIRDLEYATVFKWSPMVLNGHGFGVLANHSLVLASYLSRAGAAVLDLRVLMERG